MRETFPQKAAGDQLEASHVNRLSHVARKVASGLINSGMHGNDGHLNPPPLFVMTTLKVSDGSGTLMGIDGQLDPDEEDPRQVKARPQYWHEKDEGVKDDKSEWRNKTEEEDNEYDIDVKAGATGLERGDTFHAFWHPQRGQYLAISPDRQNTVVPIGNGTGETLQKFDVAAIKGIENVPVEHEGGFEDLDAELKQGRFESQLGFVVDRPDLAKYKGSFAVAQSRILEGQWGWGVIAGPTQVRLHVKEINHKFAEIDEDDPGGYDDPTLDGSPSVVPLRSSFNGSFKILWKEGISDKHEAGEWIWAVGIVLNGGETPDTFRRVRVDGRLESGQKGADVPKGKFYDFNEESKTFELSGKVEEIYADTLEPSEWIKSGSVIWVGYAYEKWWYVDSLCSVILGPEDEQ